MARSAEGTTKKWATPDGGKCNTEQHIWPTWQTGPDLGLGWVVPEELWLWRHEEMRQFLFWWGARPQAILLPHSFTHKGVLRQMKGGGQQWLGKLVAVVVVWMSERMDSSHVWWWCEEIGSGGEVWCWGETKQIQVDWAGFVVVWSSCPLCCVVSGIVDLVCWMHLPRPHSIPPFPPTPTHTREGKRREGGHGGVWDSPE